MDPILKNIVRVGLVSSVDPATGTVRVAFEDGLVSYDLPVIVPQTLKNKDYCMPDVGEHVVCLFLPPGNAQGFVLGAHYSSGDTPPVNDPNKRGTWFAEGTYVEFDRSTSTLAINCKGPITIKATGNVIVTGDVIADGISLKNHIHPESIGSVTGKPQ